MKILHHLTNLQDHMKSVGPKVMSQEKLLLVLGSLYPWQLASPDISSAIEVMLNHFNNLISYLLSHFSL